MRGQDGEKNNYYLRLSKTVHIVQLNGLEVRVINGIQQSSAKSSPVPRSKLKNEHGVLQNVLTT